MYDYIIYNGELYHYGVKGMRWGHRKRQDTPVGQARAAYKQAKKDYNKSFNRAYNYSSRHLISQYTNKKRRAESDMRWEDATDKGKKVNEAQTAYKQAKKDYNDSEEGKAVAAARRKKALKVGAAVAGTVLAAYGAKKLHDVVRDKNYNIRMEQASKYIDKNRHSSAFTKYIGQDWKESIAADKRYSEFVRDTYDSYSNKAKTDKFSTAAKNVAKNEFAKYKAVVDDKKAAKNMSRAMAEARSQAAKKAQEEAQTEYIRRMMKNQKSNRTYI